MMLKGDEENGCVNINNFADPVIDYSSKYKIDNYDVENAFSLNKNSIWSQEWKTPIVEGMYSYAVLPFPDYFYFYFNLFSIIPGERDKKERDPINLSIEGLNRHSEWKNIGNLENIEYKDEDIPENVYNFNETTLYTKLRINITKIREYTDENHFMDVRHLGFRQCANSYCQGDVNEGIPDSNSGTIITVPCHDKTDLGNRTLECPIGNNPMWIEIYSRCDDIPSIIKQYNTYTLEEGVKYNNLRLFSASGKNIVYSMNNQINGLELNEDGTLSGYPLIHSDLMQVSFNVSNKYGYVIINIDIIINPVTSPKIIETYNDITFTAGIPFNDKVIFKAIGNDLVYSCDNLPEGITINSTTGLLSGMYYDNKGGDYVFKISNNYGSILQSVSIAVKYVPRPIRISSIDNISLFYYETYDKIYPIRCIGPSIRYSIVSSDLPNNLTYNINTGILYGKPLSLGLVNLKVKCQNIDGSYEQTTHINIIEPTYPILINHKDVVIINVGYDIYNLSICNITGQNLTFDLSLNLPNGLTFSRTTGTINGLVRYGFSNITIYLTCYAIVFQ